MYPHRVDTCVRDEFTSAVRKDIGSGVTDNSAVLEAINHLSADAVASSKYEIRSFDVAFNQSLTYDR